MGYIVGWSTIIDVCLFGSAICSKDHSHKSSGVLSHGCRPSCTNVGEYFEWVSAVGIGRGTGVWSDHIVTYKCNIENKIQLVKERFALVGIRVQGEKD